MYVKVSSNLRYSHNPQKTINVEVEWSLWVWVLYILLLANPTVKFIICQSKIVEGIYFLTISAQNFYVTFKLKILQMIQKSLMSGPT